MRFIFWLKSSIETVIDVVSWGVSTFYVLELFSIEIKTKTYNKRKQGHSRIPILSNVPPIIARNYAVVEFLLQAALLCIPIITLHALMASSVLVSGTPVAGPWRHCRINWQEGGRSADTGTATFVTFPSPVVVRRPLLSWLAVATLAAEIHRVFDGSFAVHFGDEVHEFVMVEGSDWPRGTIFHVFGNGLWICVRGMLV